MIDEFCGTGVLAPTSMLVGPYIMYDTRVWDGSISQTNTYNAGGSASRGTAHDSTVLQPRGALPNLGSAGAAYDLFVLKHLLEAESGAYSRLEAASHVGLSVNTTNFHADTGGLPTASPYIAVFAYNKEAATPTRNNAVNLTAGYGYIRHSMSNSAFDTFLEMDSPSGGSAYNYVSGTPSTTLNEIWILSLSITGAIDNIWRNGVSVKTDPSYFVQYVPPLTFPAGAMTPYEFSMPGSSFAQHSGYVGQWGDGLYAFGLYRGVITPADITALLTSYASAGMAADPGLPEAALPLSSLGPLVYKSLEWRHPDWRTFYRLPNLGTLGSGFDIACGYGGQQPITTVATATTWAALGGTPASTRLNFLIETGSQQIAYTSSIQVGGLFSGVNRYLLLSYDNSVATLGLRMMHGGTTQWQRWVVNPTGPGITTDVVNHVWVFSFDAASATVQIWRDGVDVSAAAYIHTYGTVADTISVVPTPSVTVSHSVSSITYPALPDQTQVKSLMLTRGSFLSAPYLLYDSRNWPGGVNTIVNEGYVGSSQDLPIIVSGSSKRAQKSFNLVSWSSFGGVPSAAPITFMFRVGHYVTANLDTIIDFENFAGTQKLFGVIFQAVASLYGYARQASDLTTAADDVAVGYFSDVGQSYGTISFQDSLFVITINYAAETVQIWRDGVSQLAQARTFTSLAPSGTGSNVDAALSSPYLQIKMGITDPAPASGVWADSIRGMAMFRGSPSAADLTYWQTYFA